jgi:peroxiredoxin
MAEKEGINPVVVLIVAAAVAVVVVAVLLRSEKFKPVVAGTPAIEIVLPDHAGRERTLKEFSGKVVFLNIWATWCKPCAEELPSMQRLYAMLEGKPFEIVAVSIDSKGPEAVKEFIDRFGVTFTVLHDRKGKIKETYKTTGVPETFIIDQNGIIAEKVVGPRDWTKMTSLSTILDLLENGPRQKQAYLK